MSHSPTENDPTLEPIAALFAELVYESTGIERGSDPGQYLLCVELVRDDHLRFEALVDNRQDFEAGSNGYIDIVITSWAQGSDDFALAALSTARALGAFLTAE
jgi:hypothetical protein